MSFLGSLTVVLMAALLVGHFWDQVAESLREQELPRCVEWIVKGLVVPAFVWFLLNTGWVGRLPALVQGPGPVPGTAAWFRLLPGLASPGLAALASFWGAISLAWLLTLVVESQKDRREFILPALFGSALGLPVAALAIYLGGWVALGVASTVLSALVLHGLLPFRDLRPGVPTYGAVTAHIKFGRYVAAEEAVIRELELFPDDYDGWMMLAELYAVRFKDVAAAEQTICELCDQPNVNAVQTSLALHRLADWHLRLGEDPESARWSLHMIETKLPGTHFARMARQRRDQLPATRAELRERNQGRRIRLPALTDPLDDPQPRAAAIPAPDAEAAARRLCERWAASPNEVGPREELARLLAESLGRPEAAIEQLESLLAMPEAQEEKQREWLALIAAWHLRLRRDPAAARPFLERLVRDHPQSGQAFTAQRRLNLLNLEDRIRASQARLPEDPPRSS